MNPQYADAYGALALLLCDEKRFEDAEPAARKAVELDADSWQASYELARALYGLNRLAEAEPVVQAAINLRPDDGALHLLSANIHQRLHNYTALIDDLNAYLKIDPNGEAAAQARQMRDQVQQSLALGQGASAGPVQQPTTQP
jgi:tetratricopeptide (TPR) repeat protein